MQAHKAKTGARFEYSTARLSHLGMLRAWSAEWLSDASRSRKHKLGIAWSARQIANAQKWRIKAEFVEWDNKHWERRQ